MASQTALPGLSLAGVWAFASQISFLANTPSRLAVPAHLYYIVLQTFSEYWYRHMGSLTIRLDDKLEREITRLAKMQHKTKSEVARELLRRHVLVRELDQLRTRLLPYSEAAGYLADDDFFRDIS